MARPVGKRSKSVARYNNKFQREARQLKQLKRRFNKSARLTVQTAIEMGKVLSRVREGFGERGGFVKWVRQHFGSEDEAQKFMAIARYAKANTANLRHTHLAVSALYELARSNLPQEVVDDIVARNKAGEKITAKEIDMRVQIEKQQTKHITMEVYSEPQHTPATSITSRPPDFPDNSQTEQTDSPDLLSILAIAKAAVIHGTVENVLLPCAYRR
jgi:hypothetical protein